MPHQKVESAIGVRSEVGRPLRAVALDAARTETVDRERHVSPGRDTLSPTFVDVPIIAGAAMQQDHGGRGARTARTSQVTSKRVRACQRRFDFDEGTARRQFSRRTFDQMSDQKCPGEDNDLDELRHRPPPSWNTFRSSDGSLIYPKSCARWPSAP